MKTIHRWLPALPLAAALAMLAGCSGSDDLTDTNIRTEESVTGGMRVVTFSGTASAPATRTTLTHLQGGNAQFYWTDGDFIFVKDDRGQWVSSDTLKLKGPGVQLADFRVKGEFGKKTEYEVRYMGNQKTDTGKKVTHNSINIKTDKYVEEAPNAPGETGRQGDCGTAVARPIEGGSRFGFRLDHSIAVICVLPYSTNKNFGWSLNLNRMQILTDRNIAGNFHFNDDGTLKAQDSGAESCMQVGGFFGYSMNGLRLRNTKPDLYRTSAYYIVAPGDYNARLAVQLTDPGRCTMNDTLDLGKLKLEAGKIYELPVPVDKNITEVPDPYYYLWDAKEDLWKSWNPWTIDDGYMPAQPVVHGTYTANTRHAPESRKADSPNGANWGLMNHVVFIPSDESDESDESDGYVIYPSSQSSTYYSCKACPTVAELAWYVMKGDPHFVPGRMKWFLLGHFYYGGLWLKKKEFIEGFNKGLDGAKDPDGKTKWDIFNALEDDKLPTITDRSGYPVAVAYENAGYKIGMPADTSKYFFLPMTGQYVYDPYNKKFKFDIGPSRLAARYWSSTGYYKAKKMEREFLREKDGKFYACQLSFDAPDWPYNERQIKTNPIRVVWIETNNTAARAVPFK